jgi:hypothetical protein
MSEGHLYPFNLDCDTDTDSDTEMVLLANDLKVS